MLFQCDHLGSKSANVINKGHVSTFIKTACETKIVRSASHKKNTANQLQNKTTRVAAQAGGTIAGALNNRVYSVPNANDDDIDDLLE